MILMALLHKRVGICRYGNSELYYISGSVFGTKLRIHGCVQNLSQYSGIVHIKITVSLPFLLMWLSDLNTTIVYIEVHLEAGLT